MDKNYYACLDEESYNRDVLILCDCKPKDPDKREFYNAIKNGQFSTCLYNVKKKGMLRKCRDYICRSPLHIAVSKNQIKIAKLFISYGEDVNCLSGDENSTPLESAVELNYVEMVKLLIISGSDTSYTQSMSGGIRYLNQENIERAIRNKDSEKLAKSIAIANLLNKVHFVNKFLWEWSDAIEYFWSTWTDPRFGKQSQLNLPPEIMFHIAKFMNINPYRDDEIISLKELETVFNLSSEFYDCIKSDNYTEYTFKIAEKIPEAILPTIPLPLFS